MRNLKSKSRFVLLLCVAVVFSVYAAGGMPQAAQAALEPCAAPTNEISGQGGLTVGALGLTPGALGLTPGALGLTPGALGLTPGALGLTPGALGLTPGALGDNPDAVIGQLVSEILNNLVGDDWLDNQLNPLENGYRYGERSVALIIADDFEDVDSDLLTHGELVERVASVLLARAGVPNVRIVRVDITDGVNNFVVNDVVDGSGNVISQGIASRIRQTVANLEGQGITNFVLNLSFGLIPCDDQVMVDGSPVTVSAREFFEQRQAVAVPQPVVGVLECVAYNADGTYTAHFGYTNPNNFPIVLPYGPGNNLSGGGLTEAELIARTPVYFSVPEDNPGYPGRTNFYPNAAFQVVFHDIHTPLVWTHQGGMTVAGLESPVCQPAVPFDAAYATSVISFTQGLRSDGKPVSADRSNPTKALGAPDGTDTLNFVSLGFGGQIVLALDGPRFANPSGPDLQIVETSFNNPTFAQYPEQAGVWVSQDNVNWVFLGTAKLDANFELPENLKWFRYVKIIDTTDLAKWKRGHFGTGDGYDVDGIITCGEACVPNVEPIFECAAFDSALGTYVAHFGYNNLKGAPVFIAHGAGSNAISGGGLTPEAAARRTPELFGYPNVIAALPGRTQYYPNSALQVAFDGSPLTWSLLGPDGGLRSVTAVVSQDTRCPEISRVNDLSFTDYLKSKGVASTQAVLQTLVNRPQLDDPNLNDLIPLLQGYLDRSAAQPNFSLIPFAAAGNSAPMLDDGDPTTIVPPLAPARFPQTIAVSGFLGPFSTTLVSYSQAGNGGAPGAWYLIDDRLFAAGTSYASPAASTLGVAYSTFGVKACDFRPAAGSNQVGAVPLVGDSPNTWDNRPIAAALDCAPPVPPPQGPTCNGLVATIFVRDGVIVGGPYNGAAYSGSLIGTDMADVIVGTPGNDVIDGRNDQDVICGLDGDDVIYGGNGVDILFGDGGSDTIYGGNGDDTIYGGDGDDHLFGENGSDVIRGGAGNDFIDGGRGNDDLNGEAGDFDRIFGGEDDDLIADADGFLGAHGGPGSDTITVALRAGWRDEGGRARLDGKLSGGYGNDNVALTLADATPFFINVTGDERDKNTNRNEGMQDVLTLSGTAPKAGSVIIKFETVVYPG